MIPAVLRTPRLVLRALDAADAPALIEHLADWQVVKWLAVVPFPYTAEDAAEFVAATAPGGRLAGAGERTWAVAGVAAEVGAPGCLLGVVGLGTGPGQEFGYWLATEAWGRGLATEAGAAVLAAHFADPTAPDVASGYFEGNERSERVLAKLGFADDGGRTSTCLARGEDVPSRRMRLTREAWGAARA